MTCLYGVDINAQLTLVCYAVATSLILWATRDGKDFHSSGSSQATVRVSLTVSQALLQVPGQPSHCAPCPANI